LMPLMAAAPTMRACLLMAEMEDAEKGAAGRGREWLQRATRAHRDPAWVADGVVSAHWLPASPVTGALDAFMWTLPPAALGSDGLVIDMGESLPPVAAELPSEKRPMLIEAEAMPAAPQGVGEASAAPHNASLDGHLPPSVEKPAPVVFPIAHAPDDPGAEPVPAEPGPKRRFRLFG
ncbi:MAG: heme biosynthesis protein HemY, partial [Bosea sp. (in: a-proteobacteria)]